MRIDKLLANMGFGSRKDVKKLLKTGAVRVQGQPIKDPSTHVEPESESITVYGEEVEYKPYVYLMMNKPKGVICATEDLEHETVIDLLGEEERHYEPSPVGRLDKDTVGLLLITNDGKFNHWLMSPKHHVPKTYRALVEGHVTEEDVGAFSHGVVLGDGYVTKPATLHILEAGARSHIELILTEGKFHQVKRMFQAVGKRVLELERIKIGNLLLDPELARGEYRELTKEEIALLLEKNE
ncbi:rRNA pseudouridine synthase [Halalkalibacterium halodurans]|uniref:pseudouridine synthase n=1 Tax=Halalkalibacterium halodurans TaxID=86665 RepID=UPI00106789C1|nr:pseudouridine synthase [Halalkalibacterium halodurans]TES54382.1 rRNA pseudouridine synthase [Halalkalibacterium halodurans]